ncbi:hypothetical protein ScPMuIL_014169 [Solemya velum]
MLTKNGVFDLFEQGMNITDLLTPNGEFLGLTERTRQISETEPDDVLNILTDDSFTIETETEVTSSVPASNDEIVDNETLPTVVSCFGLEEDDVTSHSPLTIEIHSNAVEYGRGGPRSADAFSTTSSGSELTPLIKEELKYTIQSRRLAEGKDDIEVVFQEPEPEMLTAEEASKRIERRNKNKMAAQKCRMKKRQRAEELEQETQKLEMRQEHLRRKIMKLKDERDHLVDVIKVHQTVCPEL